MTYTPILKQIAIRKFQVIKEKRIVQDNKQWSSLGLEKVYDEHNGIRAVRTEFVEVSDDKQV